MMTDSRDSESPDTRRIERKATPLDYATPPKSRREPETPARAFAKGGSSAALS